MTKQLWDAVESKSEATVCSVQRKQALDDTLQFLLDLVLRRPGIHVARGLWGPSELKRTHAAFTELCKDDLVETQSSQFTLKNGSKVSLYVRNDSADPVADVYLDNQHYAPEHQKQHEEETYCVKLRWPANAGNMDEAAANARWDAICAYEGPPTPVRQQWHDAGYDYFQSRYKTIFERWDSERREPTQEEQQEMDWLKTCLSTIPQPNPDETLPFPRYEWNWDAKGKRSLRLVHFYDMDTITPQIQALLNTRPSYDASLSARV